VTRLPKSQFKRDEKAPSTEITGLAPGALIAARQFMAISRILAAPNPPFMSYDKYGIVTRDDLFDLSALTGP
jgi:hypothetical protein